MEQSFENPEQLSQEFKKHSLRSSVDEKFIYQQYNPNSGKLKDLSLPSINNSLIEYPQPRLPSNRHINENTDIQHQDSLSHRDNRLKKAPSDKNEKKATKREFERKQNAGAGGEELDQDEIDRNSTVKKVELKESFPQPTADSHVHRNMGKEFNRNGRLSLSIFRQIQRWGERPQRAADQLRWQEGRRQDG